MKLNLVLYLSGLFGSPIILEIKYFRNKDLDHFAFLCDWESRLDVISGDHDRSNLRGVQLLDRRLRLLLDPEMKIGL